MRRAGAAAAIAMLLGVAGALACGSPSSGRAAADLYTEHCARCHGEDGRGEKRLLHLDPNLDLRRSIVVARGARGLIYQRIARGYGSMPAFGHKLERGDVEALVDFVLRFRES